MQDSLCQECLETEEKTGLDLVCLLNQLAKVKGGEKTARQLSEKEKQFLCLWLSGYSNYYITFKLTKFREPSFQELSNQELGILKKQKNLLADMSKSVNGYIKISIGLDEKEKERVPHCSSVIRYFQENNICQKAKAKHELVQRKLYITVKGVDDPEAALKKIIETLRERGIDLDNLI